MLTNELELSNSPVDFTELLILAVTFEKSLLQKEQKKTKSSEYVNSVKTTLKEVIYHNSRYREEFEKEGADTLEMLDDYTSKLLHNTMLYLKGASTNFNSYMKELEETEGKKDLYGGEYEVTNWVNLFTWVFIESADELQVEINKDTHNAKLIMKKEDDFFEFHFDDVYEAHEGLRKLSHIKFNGKNVEINYYEHKVLPFLAVMASALVESVVDDNPKDSIDNTPTQKNDNNANIDLTVVATNFIQ